MADQKEPQTPTTAPKPRRDIAAIIKYILLVFLVILLIAEIGSGEFAKLREGANLSWLILLIKLLLIALLIWLIQVQRRLRCDITGPTGCTDETINTTVGGLVVEAVGSAGGATFSHYTLEWRAVDGKNCQEDADFSSEGVVYPGGGGTGGSPVTSGTLGWIDTTFWDAGAYEIRLCVYSSQPGGNRTCCCTQFDLFKKMVWIDHVTIHNDGAVVKTPPGPFAGDAPIVDMTDNVLPVGACVTIQGAAWVGECNNRKIKCFDLRYGAGFLPGPNDPGFNPAAYTGSLLSSPVCYTPPGETEKRAPINRIVGRELTTKFVEKEIELFPGHTIKVWKLSDYCFDSAAHLPECPDAEHHCHSGKYTLLLQVEDTLGNMYYDTQHIWFDNKPIHVNFTGIKGLAKCSDLSLSALVPPNADCSVTWPAELEGIVYDEYIDEADTTAPSDNFDYYLLNIVKQGGPTYHVPITPDLVTLGSNPHRGTARVGDPGHRCETELSGCSPVTPVPANPIEGLLSKIDLRIFDAECMDKLSPPFKPTANFALKRGECCGYTFELYARDKTWSDGRKGGLHRHWAPAWAVCICNDLSKK